MARSFCSDLGFHIAADRSWRGRRVNGGAVLYLAAEGGNGIANRFVALRETTKILNVPLALRRAGVDLLRSNADVQHIINLAQEIEKRAPLALIVVDTLSRAMAGGDENSAVDMTSFIRNIDRIRQATGAAMLIVHHWERTRPAAPAGIRHSGRRQTPKLRSWWTMPATAPLRLKSNAITLGARYSTLRCGRSKIGTDPDGEPVTTCLVETLDAPPAGDGTPPRTTCLEMLRVIDKAWQENNPLSMSPQTKATRRYAPRLLADKFRQPQQAVNRLLAAWIDNEIVTSEVADRKTKRGGLRVLKWL